MKHLKIEERPHTNSYSTKPPMQSSRFNLFVKATNNDYILFNTISRKSALIPSKLVAGMGWDISHDQIGTMHRSLIGDGPGQEERLPEVANLPQEMQAVFESYGFLVRDLKEDYDRLDAFLAKGYEPDTFYPTVAYTARCDLDCSYCFEEGVDRTARQSAQLTEQTIAYIDTYLNNNPGLKAVNLGLFGGEPLIDIPIAEKLIDGVAALSASRNIGFSFSITTNGTHLKRKLIDNWTKRGLTYIRITLDGPKEIHDSRRYTRSGRGTYDLILSNLRSIADLTGFQIGIEVNLDAHNSYFIDELLNDLEEAGLRERIELIPEQTLSTLASSCGGGSCSPDHHCSKFGLQQESLTNAFVHVVESAIRRGFILPDLVGVYYPCVFVQKHHVVIDWEGGIYKCSFTIGNDGFKVGDIESGFNSRNKDLLGASKVVEICKQRECAYIPICGGGCRYESWNINGSFNVVNCKADLIDAVAPRTIPASLGVALSR